MATALIAWAASALPSAAQTVLLRVVDDETSAPIFGAVAHLLDEQGAVVRSVLSDEQGRALFVSIPAARYRARAEMIGMATLESDVFDVTDRAAAPLEMRLVPRAIDLEAIDVRAERRRCVARPTQEGLAVARLWDEARKALVAAAITEVQGLYRYETMTYERDVDPDTRMVIRDDETRRTGYARSPFESLPPDDLVEGGFVRRDGADLVYYAPDANVLLSDAFLGSHCFRLVDPNEGEELIGLSFEPLEQRRRVADVGGTLWLDRSTAELRWLEYTYYNLDLPIRTAGAGGRVDFRRMPAGTWIVPDWWIEMPIIGTRMLDNGSSRPALTRMRRSGGRVLEVHEAGGRSLGGRNPTGGIEGIVVDSVGAPVEGARVGAVGWSQEAFTDARGAFALLGMREGTYEVRFVDPRLAALGLVPPLVEREVIPGEVSYLQLHLPPVGDLLRAACRDSSGATDVGVLAGRLLDRDGRPVAGGTVRAVWSRYERLGGDPAGVMIRDTGGLETTTESDGSYRLCGVRRGERLDVVSIVDGVERPAEAIAIGEQDVGALLEIRRRD
ncbi:MAG: carboxypeptidase-like regulatory domain-containing protein [Gemmatimonadales bacterium]